MKNRLHKTKKGMTLLELVLAMAVTGVIMAMGVSFVYSMSDYFETTTFNKNVKYELITVRQDVEDWFYGSSEWNSANTANTAASEFAADTDSKYSHNDSNNTIVHPYGMDFVTELDFAGTNDKLLICTVTYKTKETATETQKYRIVLAVR